MNRPLEGKRILVLRARTQAAPFLAQIEALGGEGYPFPVITIADPDDWGPLDEAIRHLERYRWLVITSPNGAERFAARLARWQGSLAGVRVAAVGTATAEALAERGITVDLLPREFRGRALPEAMAPLLSPGDRVLLARGDLADRALAEGLKGLGARVDDLIAYRTLPYGDDPTELKRLLAQGEIHYAAFTSGSTVQNLLDQIGGPGALSTVRIACIGPETARVAGGLGLTIHCTAQPHTLEGLLHAIVEDCRQGGR
ncbi:MAG: uroporphyrinogen-III synthase [Bacillota bacterium]